MEVRTIRNITKEYPDMIKVMIYKEPKLLVKPEYHEKRNRELVDNESYRPVIRSLSRTKTLIRDIVLCNDFDYFCTFTFDPDKVDRFSYEACLHKINVFIHHQKGKSADFSYLIVPEQHKNGAWHFHALISHFNGTMRNSNHKSPSGRIIYNITSFRSGFSTAVKIDNKSAVANYVTKYITKDFIKQFNRKRFTCSRNLVRPIKTINSLEFSLSLPLFRKKVFENDEIEHYELIPL